MDKLVNTEATTHTACEEVQEDGKEITGQPLGVINKRPVQDEAIQMEPASDAYFMLPKATMKEVLCEKCYKSLEMLCSSASPKEELESSCCAKVTCLDQKQVSYDEYKIINAQNKSLMGENCEHHLTSSDLPQLKGEQLAGDSYSKEANTLDSLKIKEPLSDHSKEQQTYSKSIMARNGQHSMNVPSIPNKARSLLLGKDARLIGKYEVIKELGKGAQGVVYKCRDIESNKIAAIKSMPMTGLGRRWNRRRPAVSREVALLKKVKHPNLVSLIEVMNDDENKVSHIVIEYVDGGPLEELSDEALLSGTGTPLREDEARHYFRQLLSALQYLHYHKILHRDIKPSNLLVNRKTGILKVTDLGVAVSSTEEKAHRVLGSDDNILAYANVSGTPAFLPPEYYRLLRGNSREEEDVQLSNKKKSSKLITFGFSSGGNNPKKQASSDSTASESDRTATSGEENQEEWNAPALQYFNGRPADIWVGNLLTDSALTIAKAAGVTLYAFTYGKLPFAPVYKKGSKRNSQEVIQSLQDQIISAPLRFPGTGFGVSSKLRQLLNRMLEKNPLKRIQMRDLLVDPWVCYFEAMPPLSGAEKSSIEPTTKEVNIVISEMRRLTRNIRAEAHRWSSIARNSMSTTLSSARSASQDTDGED